MVEHASPPTVRLRPRLARRRNCPLTRRIGSMTNSNHIQLVTGADGFALQDYLLTKTVLLLNRDAHPSEWAFECRTLRAASGRYWNRNAFLLDFTLGRHLAVRDDDPVAGFVRYFTGSIRSGAGSSARTIWAAERYRADADPDATTTALLTPLVSHGRWIRRTDYLHLLPGPYHDALDELMA